MMGPSMVLACCVRRDIPHADAGSRIRHLADYGMGIAAHVPADVMFGKCVAAWQWHNYLCSKVPGDKRVLRLNLDETSVCLFQGSRFGNLFINKATQPSVHVPHAKKRTYLSHVAIVCDDADVQKLLPQVIIGSSGDKHRVIGRPPSARLGYFVNAFGHDVIKG